MSPKRFALALLAVFGGIFATDFLIHSVWLKDDYLAAMGLWRPEPEMLDRFGWIVRGEFLAALAFVSLWAGFVKNSSIGRACAFGLVIALFNQSTTLVNYALQPIPGSLAGKWFAAGLVQSVLIGLIVSVVYKPRPASLPPPTRKEWLGWLAAPGLMALGLFASPFLLAGTRQPPVKITAEWMQQLNSKWIIESPGKLHSVQSVSEIKPDGADSLRFELRQGELWTDAYGKTTFRAEVDTKDFPPMNSVRWYAFSLFLPKDFPIEDNRLILAQWHGADKVQLGEVNRSPALAVRFADGRLTITVRHSDKRIVKEADSVPKKLLYEDKNYPLGEWNRFVVQAKWSFKNDGFVNVWLNGEQIAQYRGPVGYNDNVGPYFRFGLYRDETDRTYVAYFNQVKSGCNPEEIGFDPTGARLAKKQSDQ